MKVALFTSGDKTLLGKTAFDGNMEYSFFESKILFQDPDLLYERFVLLLNKKFAITNPKDITELTFGISGIVDTGRGMIINSYNLNQIAGTKLYNGYNFKDTFGNLVNKENIHVANDAFITALGVSVTYLELPKPSIIIQIDKGVGISYITAGGDIHTTEWGGDFIPETGDKTAQYLLGKDSIDELLLSGVTDIYREYTDNLILVIKFVIDRFKRTNGQVNSVFILTTKEEYIEKDYLYRNCSGSRIFFAEGTDEVYAIPITGCLNYSAFKDNLSNIIRIEYWSGGEKIYSFESFISFKEHWTSVKPLANQDNTYRVIYADNAQKEIKMKDLNQEFELEAYKF